MKLGFICAAIAIAATGDGAHFTFHKDVETILQKRCQGCHRPGEAAPMPLLTYAQARPWAKAIRASVLQKKMPPWFADPRYGKFSNDRTLTKTEIDILTAWADAGAPQGDPKEAPKPLEFTEGWSIGEPDMIVEMPKAFAVPASGTIPYQYVSVPSGLTEDKWVQATEIRPGDRSVVHHVWVFARDAKQGSYTASKPGEFVDTAELERRRQAAMRPGVEPDMFSSGVGVEALQGYSPGNSTTILPPGQAKLIKAGSVFLFQLHYTVSGKAAADRTRIGLIWAKAPPSQRVKTVNVQNFAFKVPPRAADHPIDARARLTRDVTLLSLRPHMHFRGRSIDVRVTYPQGESETLLSVPQWNFAWQLNYNLSTPKLLPKGTVIEVLGRFDNSANNPVNPDPNVEVVYGEQTWNEMLASLMDVVIESGIPDPELFEAWPKRAESSRIAKPLSPTQE